VAYDLGDVVSLSVSITDSAGAAADATAVTLTVAKPDGTTETPSVTHGGVGSYSCDYTPATAGRYTVRWVATGTNSSAFTDIFDVRAAASTQLLSLADAKAALNLTATTNDEELRGYIEATTALIEERIGPVVQRTVTETVTGWGSLVLSKAPVISVTSLAGVYTNATAVAAADVTVDSASGIVTRLDRGSFLGETYEITYEAGRSTIKPNITQAAKVLLRHLWMTQRGSSSRGRGEDDTANYPASYSMPNRVLELLLFDLNTPGIA
jgi:hypothetical protein